MKRILCICFSSTIQRSINFKNIKLAQVNRSENYSKYASGKAVNSARVLEQIKENSTISFCPLGEKDYKSFLDLAKKDNLTIEYTLIPGNTRECWTLLDRENETTTELVVSEAPIPLNSEIQQIEKESLRKIKELILQVDGVLLAGSRPLIWSKNLYSQVAKFAVDNNKIFLADYIGEDLLSSLEKTNPTIIKINEEEFASTFIKEDINLSDYSFEQILKNYVIEKSKDLNNIIVVTRGSKSTFAAEKGAFFEQETKQIKVVNTTACGDSFNAGFLYEYLNTKDIKKALEKGAWCAEKNAQSQAPGSIN